MTITSFEQFAELAGRGTFVPICKEMMADLLTPVSAFLRIAEHADHAFLLESVEGGEHVARYSFLGKDPLLVLRADGPRTIIHRAGSTTDVDEPLMAVLRRLMAEYRAPAVPGLPRFTGGGVGYVGYDAATWFEPALVKTMTGPDGRAAAIPAAFMIFDTILAFDHAQHRILIIANALVKPGADLEALYRFGCARIEFLEQELGRELSHQEPSDHRPLEIRSRVSREEFEASVRRALGTSRLATSARSCCHSASRRRLRPNRSASIAPCATSARPPTCSSSAWDRRRSRARLRRCWSALRGPELKPTRLPARARADGPTRRI